MIVCNINQIKKSLFASLRKSSALASVGTGEIEDLLYHQERWIHFYFRWVRRQWDQTGLITQSVSLLPWKVGISHSVKTVKSSHFYSVRGFFSQEIHLAQTKIFRERNKILVNTQPSVMLMWFIQGCLGCQASCVRSWHISAILMIQNATRTLSCIFMTFTRNRRLVSCLTPLSNNRTFCKAKFYVQL